MLTFTLKAHGYINRRVLLKNEQILTIAPTHRFNKMGRTVVTFQFENKNALYFDQPSNLLPTDNHDSTTAACICRFGTSQRQSKDLRRQ